MSTIHEEPSGRKEHARWRGNGTRETEQETHALPLSATHLQQLHARGLTDETIHAAGLWSATTQPVVSALGFPATATGLVIPYHDPFTQQAVLNRIRPDVPLLFDGREAKYLSPAGAKNRLYFPPGAQDWIRDPTLPVIISEGEFKVLVGMQLLLRCLGLIGVWGWKSKDEAHGPSHPIADLNRVVWQDRTVFIAFDSDRSTNPDVQRAAEMLAVELYRRGARVVCLVDIPSTETGDKNGMDDYLHEHGEEAFYKLPMTEIPPLFPPVRVWSGGDLIAADLPRPAPIVSGYGFRRGGKGILVGAGGRGKSTVLLQMAGQLSASVPLFRYGPLAVEKPQRVAMYLAEDPLSETRFRFAEQCKELGATAESIDRMRFLDFGGRRISLDKEADRVTLFRTIRDVQADVVILDPLVAIHDANENDNPAMRRVLDTLNPLCEAGMSFLIAHHEPKNPENNSASVRGASAIRDWCRTMLRLTAHGKGEMGSSRYTLDLDKYNYGGTVWNLTLERLQDSYIFTVAADESKVTAQQVWALIGPDERWFTEVLQEIVSTFSVSQSTAARALKKAEELSLVIVGTRENPETGRAKKTITRGRGPEVSEDE